MWLLGTGDRGSWDRAGRAVAADVSGAAVARAVEGRRSQSAIRGQGAVGADHLLSLSRVARGVGGRQRGAGGRSDADCGTGSLDRGQR